MAGSSLYQDDDGSGAITDINVTPFVDVVLVLLVVFIVTAKLIVARGVEIDKPKAANAEQETLSNIAEALSATAIGLLVAIPAVIAFNFFSRRVRVIMGGADEVAHAVLSLVHGAEHVGRGATRKEADDGGR